MATFKQGLFTPAVLTLALAAPHAVAGEHEHRAHGAHEHGAANIDLILAATEIAIQWRTPAANLLGFEHKPKTDEQHKAVKQANATLADFNNVLALPASAECKLLKYDVAGLAFETAGHDKHDDHHDDHDKEHGHDKHDDHHDDHDKEHGHDKHDDHHDDHDKEHGHDKHDDHHDDHDKEHGHDKHDDHHDDHDKEHGHDKHDDHDKEHGHDDHAHDDHDESSHSDVVINYQLQCSKPTEIKAITFTLFKHFSGTEKVMLQGIVNDQQLMQTLTPSNDKLAW
ncbi:ZrgA family zinc uptake protein [Motilimonas pumila]|uniref:DUF2796 domain-containing protein n=1 Tax=Motilimonas pumila TaxID=2303987 RepID=A0A418YC72_9GAMM|nr:DUF2796 domain-containing protein [Motilimonas pumila]RJG42059.1 DUF2796 domain-containing protein [Motilimonas pumila]